MIFKFLTSDTYSEKPRNLFCFMQTKRVQRYLREKWSDGLLVAEPILILVILTGVLNKNQNCVWIKSWDHLVSLCHTTIAFLNSTDQSKGRISNLAGMESPFKSLF